MRNSSLTLRSSRPGVKLIPPISVPNDVHSVKQTSLSAVDSALPDEFIKALSVELSTDLANAGLTSLSLLQFLIQLLLVSIQIMI